MFALAALALLVLPYVAHRLRRRSANEVPFAALRFVDRSPPEARKRSRLEDKTLFLIRALAVCALALLGASPYVRCTRLGLSRKDGASLAMALVLDDSMSMRALVGGKSSFTRAKEGALEVLSGCAAGDLVALVLAGAPPRVVISPTADFRLVSETLQGLSESDRATALADAMVQAESLLSPLPQVDKRIVVLSDLSGDDAPMPPPSGMVLTFPLPEIAFQREDCGVVFAERLGGDVRAHVRCTSPQSGRDVRLLSEGKVLSRRALGSEVREEVVFHLTSEAKDLSVELGAGDPLESDDRLPVVEGRGLKSLGAISDELDPSSVSVSALLEKAVRALSDRVHLTSMPAVPDGEDGLAPFSGIWIEDPAGFTPEQRSVLRAFLDKGGVVFLTLGPRAGAAPLGSSFAPLLDDGVLWVRKPEVTWDESFAMQPLADTLDTLRDLGARGRTEFSGTDRGEIRPLARFGDGAPALASREMGRGLVFFLALPLSPHESDLALRPAFLALLEHWIEESHTHVGAGFGRVGSPQIRRVKVMPAVSGPGPVEVVRTPEGFSFVPTRVGVYAMGGDRFVAGPVEREIDFRPRSIDPGGDAGGGGVGRMAARPIAWMVALGLLVLLVCEGGLRLRQRRFARS